MLSATQVKAVKQPGRYTDGRRGYGLSLLVRPAADGGVRKTWTQRLRINGRWRNIGLGPFPIVALSEARETAFENARGAWRGTDPVEVRQALRGIPTFEQALESTIELRAPVWKDKARTAGEWRTRLQQHARTLMGRRVDQIQRPDVHRVLTPIWSTRHETAMKVKQHIDLVLQLCKDLGYVSENVAAGIVMPKMRPSTQNHPALLWQDMNLFRKGLEESQANPAAKLAAMFMTLTAARPGEVINARWSQVDGAVWSLGGDDMKAGRAHKVPLSRAALRLLDEAKVYSDSDRIFNIGVNAIKSLFAAMQLPSDTEGKSATAHGQRCGVRHMDAGDRPERGVEEVRPGAQG